MNYRSFFFRLNIFFFCFTRKQCEGYNSWFDVTITPAKFSSPNRTAESPKPRLVQRNVSNTSISRIYVNTWERKDHVEWMDGIYPGDQIGVHGISGWHADNTIELVRIDVYCAW